MSNTCYIMYYDCCLRKFVVCRTTSLRKSAHFVKSRLLRLKTVTIRLIMSIYSYVNCVSKSMNPDETPSYSASHPELNCLKIAFWSRSAGKWLNKWSLLEEFYCVIFMLYNIYPDLLMIVVLLFAGWLAWNSCRTSRRCWTV